MRNRPSPETGARPARPPSLLIQMLIREAQLRGDTLVSLARQLGVSYRRFAQWHNASADIRAARPETFTNAAGYLQLPRITVLAYAGVLTLQDLAHPQPLARDVYLHREMEEIRKDPAIGPFMPPSLSQVPWEVQTFVAFLYHENRSSDAPERANWFRELQEAMTVAYHDAQPPAQGDK